MAGPCLEEFVYFLFHKNAFRPMAMPERLLDVLCRYVRMIIAFEEV